MRTSIAHHTLSSFIIHDVKLYVVFSDCTVSIECLSDILQYIHCNTDSMQATVQCILCLVILSVMLTPDLVLNANADTSGTWKKRHVEICLSYIFYGNIPAQPSNAACYISVLLLLMMTFVYMLALY